MQTLLKILAAFALLVAIPAAPAVAQSAVPRVVTACGAMSPANSQIAGANGVLTVDPTGANCVNSQPLGTAVITGQVIIAVTGTAVQLPSHALTNGVVVKSKGANNVACGAVGSSGVLINYDGSGNGYGICPGEPTPGLAVSNTNAIWVNGYAGDIFTFMGN